jgi:Na+-driven multidrug efflux pump
MNAPSRVERLGTEKIGKLLLEMSSQTTLSLLVYAIYSVTDTYFLSVGINSLAAAGASIISPVLMALGGVATTVGPAAHRWFRGRSARRKLRRLPGRSPIPS